MKISKTRQLGNYKIVEGQVKNYYFQAQVFVEPSHFGIADGRISRLCISNRESFGLRDCMVNYDRGWDGGPPKGELQSVVDEIVLYFDKKNVNWAFEQRRS